MTWKSTDKICHCGAQAVYFGLCQPHLDRFNRRQEREELRRERHRERGWISREQLVQEDLQCSNRGRY